MTTTHNVTLLPSQSVITVPENTNLLEALKAQGLYIKSSCGGHATCSDCIVKVCAGADSLNPPPFNEVRLLGNVFHITKERLCCQTMITGDITLDISAHNQLDDEERLQQKTRQTAGSFRVRKREDLEQKAREEEEQKAQQQLEYEKKKQAQLNQTPEQESWFKHWEKKEDQGLKTRGGQGKPKRRHKN